MTSLPNYCYNGARALILLHETHLRSFLKTWKEAKELDIKLPETNDTDYESLETLLHHLLRSARGYMFWMCDKLGLDDPQIDRTPAPGYVEDKAEVYLEHLLERYRIPLVDVKEELFFDKVYKSRWGVDYCIEAMLEHAVMHPERHEFQLKNLIVKGE